MSDDVIACNLWFGPPPIKNPGYAYGPGPPQLKFNDLFNQRFPWLIFFKYLVRKNRRGWR